MLERNFKIETSATHPEFDLEELLTNKKVSPEITEIIQKHEYLSKALQLTQEKLDDSQLTHILSIAERAGGLSSETLSQEECDLMVQAAIIHDVGKTQTEEMANLVTNGNKFGATEKEKIENHVRLMIKWAEENGVPREVIAIAARHHEFIKKETAKNKGFNGYPRNNGERRANGNGNNYENRQNGDRRDPELNTEQINRLGHILHVIDEFDANRQPRSYKEACSLRLCKKILIDKFSSPEDIIIIDALIEMERIKNKIKNPE